VVLREEDDAMTLPVDYTQVITLVLAIFAFVGLMRGWYREGVTSLFTIALAVLAWKREVAEGIIGVVNDLIRIIAMFFKAKGSLDPSRLAAQAVDPKILIDPASYQIYVVVTVGMVIISYVVGKTAFTSKVTPLSRILGGILGAFNGYVILSLLKEYALHYMRAKNQLFVASDQLAITLTQVPTGSFFAGPSIVFTFVVLIGVIALLIAGDRLKLPLK